MKQVQSVVPMSSMTQEELKELFSLSSLPASADDLDPNKLPDETLEEFSYDGLEFEEAALQTWRHLTIMHCHAGMYNRHSDYFPIACAQLEKAIRTVGSFCLTKTVLEAQGAQFPNLEDMNIRSLYGLTSYYFRKCGKAFDDIYDKAGLISIQMHKWEMRWLELGERLKATEAKCQEIRDKKIDVEKLLKRTESIKGPTPAGESKPIQEPKELEIWQNALPLIGTYARQVKRERKYEAWVKYFNNKIHRMAEEQNRWDAKEEARKRKAERNRTSSEEKQADPTVPVDKKTENEPVGTASGEMDKKENGNGNKKEISPDEMSPLEFRKKLVEMARERGEGSDLMQILGDPPEKLHERWRRYQEEDKQRKRSVENSGPHNQKSKNPKKKKRK